MASKSLSDMAKLALAEDAAGRTRPFPMSWFATLRQTIACRLGRHDWLDCRICVTRPSGEGTVAQVYIDCGECFYCDSVRLGPCVHTTLDLTEDYDVFTI